ncbi:protein CNPPD1 [Manduca sexta]|uniref:Protein CNPPD1 n=1 Tax=Manduca sexta TaxID=7130 RepID=A0A921ZTD8_MANSE|nr:protein CNPPD1 [Manduca sexta]KAG6462908.1 hypothetical protein O3G_MSEX013532 [Manduca sexta]
MMSSISKRRREGSRSKIKSMGDHKEFLRRITKTLYYGQLPTLPCLSLPVTEISCAAWSSAQRGRSLRRLRADAAAGIARSACVSPCALVLALLYLERLNSCNPDYIAAAEPADLFLVSLMVGNKFLQDDGEDDDVFCSEWAASGGIELKQLKKLEVEFLNAIDWNVFVSDKSFEAGLEWLERQVALRQARLRGFFTYSDLAAASDAAGLADLAAAVSRTWLALTAGYLVSVVAFLTSTLLMSHAWLPALQLVTSRTTTALQTHVLTQDHQPKLFVNTTIDPATEQLLEDTLAISAIKCCSKWTQYQEATTTKRSWNDAVIVQEWKLEPWWSRTSVLNWLYQSSLINPMQRWLDKLNQYADLFRGEVMKNSSGEQVCGVRGRCHWPQLGRLSVLAAVSDR